RSSSVVAPAPQACTAERVLAPGGHDGGALAAGACDAYTVGLEAGEFLRLAVRQDGVDVAVSVVAPDGSRRDVDVARSREGREPASVLAESAGSYRIEIRAADSRTDRGRYAIESEPARPATADDRRWLEATRLHVAGQDRYDHGELAAAV